MTARIFCKDLRLAAHPMMYVFAFFGAMLLIPSYPYTVAFFYGLLGIFFTFLNGRENKDVYYCAVLPVTKREQVRARRAPPACPRGAFCDLDGAHQPQLILACCPGCKRVPLRRGAAHFRCVQRGVPAGVL